MTPKTLALVLALAGCGATQTEPIAPTTLSRGDVVCRSVTPTGSHLPRTSCRSRAEIEREREAARRERDQTRAQQ